MVRQEKGIMLNFVFAFDSVPTALQDEYKS